MNDPHKFGTEFGSDHALEQSAPSHEVAEPSRNTKRGLSMSHFLSCRNELAILNFRLDSSQLFVALYRATFGRGDPCTKTIDCSGCRI
jgi:hypothetical protein